jgi:hypothetical protein
LKYSVEGQPLLFFVLAEEVGLDKIEKALGVGHYVHLVMLPTDLKALSASEQILDFALILWG